MLARARGVPLVTGLGRCARGRRRGGARRRGRACSSSARSPRPAHAMRAGSPSAAPCETSRAERALAAPAVTADGERVEVMINVDDPGAVTDGLLAAADGVGLMRTEFLFIGRDRLPDEDEQSAAYRRPARPARRQAGASSAPSTSAATSRCPASACPRRATRSSACAACACAWSGPSCSGRRSAPCCAPPWRAAQGDAADGRDGRRARGGARVLRRLPRGASGRRRRGRDAAARHHGRDAGRGRRRSS